MSARLGERVFITPSGAIKGELTPLDISVMSVEGQHLQGPPPRSEHRLHLQLYFQRPYAGAVVHAHPVHATAYTLFGGWPEDLSFYPEALAQLGPVAVVPFGMPGTGALPESVRPYAKDHKAFLLQNHGAVTIGTDLVDAANRMESLERVAQILASARDRKTIPLPAEDAQVLIERYGHGRLDGEPA